MLVIETISRILSYSHKDNSVIAPTLLYSEGWMLRITLDWYTRLGRAASRSPFVFESGARWYSEGYLATQFSSRKKRDCLGESHTRADGVIGHFNITPGKRSEIQPEQDATQLIAIEAKLKSNLSTDTKNAPGYDQAARTVGCLAHIVGKAQISPKALKKYGFYVVCPEKRLSQFEELVSKESIRAKVDDRVSQYGADRLAWYRDTFLPHLEAMNVGIITWENLLANMESKGASRDYRDFYMTCCEYANL